MGTAGRRLVRVARELGSRAAELRFGGEVSHVYNPLIYAFESHRDYLERFGGLGASVVLLGMNPGPWGMAQTGVPFGDVVLVREWMGISRPVDRPAREHPARPVEGFDCPRREVSGSRLWGWAKERFGAPENFFTSFFVLNYCPLSFMEASGRNRTPDKLPAAERQALFELCDQALVEMVRALAPRWVIGVGRFAEGRARRALGGMGLHFGAILHPSPASPAANRGWAGQVERQLGALGIDLPRR
ncbi:MAG: single-stranded DNA-binding protein [Acidobacteriota bacterium]|nr:single-stranded DNA-binding protein [Acidobacteriota bacterium]